LILQKITNKAQNLARLSLNDSFFENYTFTNMRHRDKHKSQIDRERDEENAKKEKMSQDPNYKKKKKNYELPRCYKAKVTTNDDDDDSDETEHDEISTFNETLNLKVKKSGVFLPVDVYDKGKMLNERK
jgi:hypothetical protein